MLRNVLTENNGKNVGNVCWSIGRSTKHCKRNDLIITAR